MYKNLARCGSTLMGLESFDGGKSWFPFTANEDLMKIHVHWQNPQIWALQDAYGIPGYTPPQGKDWSAIRDSSEPAKRAMLEVAERLQGGKPWHWEEYIKFRCEESSGEEAQIISNLEA